MKSQKEKCSPILEWPLNIVFSGGRAIGEASEGFDQSDHVFFVIQSKSDKEFFPQFNAEELESTVPVSTMTLEHELPGFTALGPMKIF